MRALAAPRQTWQIARARASVASTGFGADSRRRIRTTMPATWALSARPVPVTAAFTSLGVCHATGSPASAAARTAAADAWAVPMTVCRLCWLNIRSMATTSGESSSMSDWMRLLITSRRSGSGSEAGVVTTSTCRRVSGRPREPSTRPTPHRVRPGSTPSTRTSPPDTNRCSHPIGRRAPPPARHACAVRALRPSDRRARRYSAATGSLACTGWPTTSANPAPMHSTNSSRSGIAASSMEIPIPALPA